MKEDELLDNPTVLYNVTDEGELMFYSVMRNKFYMVPSGPDPNVLQCPYLK
jgi:hypothetical protein